MGKRTAFRQPECVIHVTGEWQNGYDCVTCIRIFRRWLLFAKESAGCCWSAWMYGRDELCLLTEVKFTCREGGISG